MYKWKEGVEEEIEEGGWVCRGWVCSGGRMYWVCGGGRVGM